VVLKEERIELVERHDVYSTDAAYRKKRLEEYFEECCVNGDEVMTEHNGSMIQ
jgi:hypothetical protein